jgi:hypothetical protein
VYNRLFHTVEGYLSQHSEYKHIGLANAEQIDSLIIEWPRGLIEKHFNLPVKEVLHFTEGQTIEPSFPESATASICPGENTLVTMTGNYVSVLWSNGEQGDSILVDEPGPLSALVTHSSGISFQTDTLLIEQYEFIELDFEISNPECYGDDSGFIHLNDPENQIDCLNWFNFGSSDSLHSLEAGIYNYNGFDHNGCEVNGSIFLDEPDELQVDHYTQEDCTLQWSGQLEITGGSPPYAIEWQLEDTEGILHVGEGDTFNCVEPGNFSWTIIDGHNCTSEGSLVLETLVGVHQNVSRSASIYPNPCTSEININTPLTKWESIVDAKGRTVIHLNQVHPQPLKVNTAELQPGLYFLLSAEGFQKKFLKQ